MFSDGEVTPDNDFTQPTSATRQAIVDASEFPLSIIMVGVGKQRVGKGRGDRREERRGRKGGEAGREAKKLTFIRGRAMGYHE